MLALALLSLVACREDGDIPDGQLDAQLLAAIEGAVADGVDGLRLPSAGDYEALPQDPRNPLTAEKVELGRLLFHETGLTGLAETSSLEGTFSCASCHHAGAGFQAGRWQGIGEGGVGFGANGFGRARAADVMSSDLDVQPLRSPSVLNVAYQEVMLWNGQFGATGPNAGTEDKWTPGTPKATNELGYAGVETQAIAGLTVHRLAIDRELLRGLGYLEAFDRVFADVDPDERYAAEFAGLAIAAYERTVVADQAPFQRWLAGETSALSEAAKRGATVFFGEAGCVSCHSGPSLASMSFHALGMGDLHDCPEPVFGSDESQAAHRGRGGFTMRPGDMYAFKTPQLYNLADSRFYGHGSSLRSLRDVVEYKNAGVPENARVPADRLSPQFRPLGLTESQVDDLVAFLEDGLRDPELARYVPEVLPSGNCFPNADPMSRMELGCE